MTMVPWDGGGGGKKKKKSSSKPKPTGSTIVPWSGGPSPTGGGGRQKLEALKAQVSGQEARLAALSPKEAAEAKKAKKKPSVLSRVFDVLSRGQYASAETFRRVATGRSIIDSIEGGIGGLAGKHKTNFNQALLESAEHDRGSLLSKAVRENRFNIRTIFGTTADIVVDPITWASGGVVPAITKGTKVVKVLKGAEEVGKTGKAAIASTKALNIIENVDHAKDVQRAVKAGENVPPEVVELAGRKLRLHRTLSRRGAKERAAAKIAGATDEEAKGIAAKLVQDEANIAIGKEFGETVKALDLLEPGRITFKMAGREVASSKALYKALATGSAKMGKTRFGTEFNKLFRTAALFPGRMNHIRRMATAANTADLDKAVGEYRTLFSGINKADDILVHKALRGEVDLNKVGRQDLDPIVIGARDSLDGLWQQGVELGLYNPKDKMEFFSYVFLKNKKGTNFFKTKQLLEQGKWVPTKKGATTLKKTTAIKLDDIPSDLNPALRASDALAAYTGKFYAKKARKQIMDGFVGEFGVTAGTKVGRQWLKEGGATGELVQLRGKFVPPGTYATRQVQKAVSTLNKMYDDDKAAGFFMSLFDKVQGQHKFFLTAANPGHHVRNLVGDTFLNYLDGVVSHIPYVQAGRVLAWEREGKLGKGIATILGKKGGTIKINSKLRMTYDEVLDAYETYGAKSGFFRTERVRGEFSPTLRGVEEKIRRAAETREDFTRLAHFIDALKKEGGKATDTIGGDFVQAAEKAAARVRKWNIDYGDLTPFEQKVMKRAIPFYTWMRKSMPLQLEALAMRPGRMAAVPKAWNAGKEGPDMGGPEVIPEYIRQMSPIRLIGEGEGKNAIYWLPVRTPLHDISEMLSGNTQENLKQVMSNLTPLARIPIELQQRRTLFGDIPIRNWTKYVAEQVPIGREAYRAYASAKDPERKFDWTKFLASYVGGQSVYPVTTAAQQGELRRQQDILEALTRKAKGKVRKDYEKRLGL